MSKLTDEQFKNYMLDDSTEITKFSISAAKMDVAKAFIERVRLINKEYPGEFLGHYCTCDPMGCTSWYLAYKPEHYDEIFERLSDAYDETIIPLLVSNHGLRYRSQIVSQACVCRSLCARKCVTNEP